MKLKNSHHDETQLMTNSKNKIFTKLKLFFFDKIQKLKSLQNLNCDKTQIVTSSTL